MVPLLDHCPDTIQNADLPSREISNQNANLSSLPMMCVRSFLLGDLGQCQCDSGRTMVTNRICIGWQFSALRLPDARQSVQRRCDAAKA
eukprot:4641125-Pyramimonas_sp.AAC.1